VPIKLGLDPERASVALGIICHVGLMLTMYWLAWVLFADRLAAGLAAASTAVVGYLVFDALNGLETTLFLALSTATAAAFFAGRSDRQLLGAGLLASLTVLARPEGVLLLVALIVYYLLDGGVAVHRSAAGLRRLALLAGPSAAVVGGLAVFYWATTGTPTPGSATAKVLFFREFAEPLTIKFDRTQGVVASFLGPVLPWLGLSLFAVRRREALLFVLFWGIFIALYAGFFPGGLAHYWYRYQHVFLPPIIVFGAGGLTLVLRRTRWTPLELAAGAGLGLLIVWALVFQYNSFRYRYAENVLVNETRQVAVADYLRQVVPADGMVATHDIGAIGYFSDRKVVDLVGLVNPEAVDYHDGRRLREYVDRVQPDYIVAFPFWEQYFLHLGLERDTELFEQVQVFDDPTRGVRDFEDPRHRVEPFFVVYRTHY